MDGYVTIAYALVVATIYPLFHLGIIGGLFGLVFGAIARSIGSLFFGNFLGDRLGRKRMLTVSILLFSIFSFLIGTIPTYSSIGIAAPILLYSLLFAVGLFAGAEYGGGAALSTESVPAEKRGFVGAFVQSGFGTGYFLAASVLSVVGFIYGPSGFISMGWRVIFFTTLIPGVLTLILRVATPESKVFSEMKEEQKVESAPMVGMFREAFGPMMLAIIITSGLLYINTGTFSFYPTALVKYLGAVNVVSSGLIIAVVNLISLLGVWFGGAFANRMGGRKTSMLVYSILFVVTALPLIYLGYSTNPAYEIIGFGIQAFIEAMIFSTLPAFLAETFSRKYRTTAIGFTYNAGGIAGGFAAVIIAFSALTVDIRVAWSLNIIIAGVIMIGAIAASKETWSMKHRNGEKDIISE